MQKLLPDELRELWATVDETRFTGEQFYHEQVRRLGRYRRIWEEALTLPGQPDLKTSLVSELARYEGAADLDRLWRRCCAATQTMKDEWEEQVDARDRGAVERYYDDSQAMMDELVWWHTLEDDLSPLAYVTALEFARQRGCGAYLDFGTGIGSGGVLFGRHGFEVTVADISPSLLEFSRWRFELRDLPARIVDTSAAALPEGAFDFITAMDVFEHLVDPVEVAEAMWRSLRPGGFLFGRFGVDEDENKPMHLVTDFGPMFERLGELGMVEVWRDEWLWGHQAYRRT
jgi:mycofactocin glycosyltransferase